MIRLAIIAALVLILCSSLADGLTRKQQDLVTNLPGLTFNPGFKSYSGFLKASPTRYFHYWLTESQGNPSKDPIVLWLNGGPGCSSLGGLFTELGPFRVNQDGKTLFENTYAWNKFTNLLFLETPAGVGFSYTTDGNNATSDNQTAWQNYAALADFFTNVFPEYQNRDFYITGESYAGVYIPTLTAILVDQINAGVFPAKLKGIAIGNGYMSDQKQDNSVVDFMYFHGVFGDENDPYNLYQDCYNIQKLGVLQSSSFAQLINGGDLMHYTSTDALSGFPCWGDGTRDSYLNMPSVQKALHIPSWYTKNTTWQDCSDIDYSRNYKSQESFFDHILTNSNISILIYNGDVDMVCNFLGDEWFANNVSHTHNLRTIQPRQAWYYAGSIAGYVKRYSRMDIMTVKGAGHFVQMDRPGPALQMIYNFINRAGNYSQPDNINITPKPLYTKSAGKGAINLILLLTAIISLVVSQ